MSITEKNKLICNFLEWYCEDPEPDGSSVYETPYMVNISDKPEWEADVDDYTSSLRLDEMQFNCDWNWLMPVVYKIETLEIDGFYDMYDIEDFLLIRDELITGRINTSFESVVEFIEKLFNKRLN